MVAVALYYSDGGPGLPTDLVRVNVEGNGSDLKAWRKASAERWTVTQGWKPYPNAQLDIGFKGELFMIDASEVPKVQAQLRERYAHTLSQLG